MKRFPLLRSALPLLALAFSVSAWAACGGPPDSARLAQRHLVRGEYQAASAAADRSLQAHPKDPTSWRVKIRSEMAQGELALAAEHYREWKTLRGTHDPTTYRLMAVSTVWQGMRVPSPEIKARSIQIVERNEVEKLATDVRDALGDDNDLVAGAAAVALLRSHPAAPQIASELLRSGSPRVRAMVVLGIGKKAGRISIGDVVPALGDSDPTVRRAAVAAIASWNNKKDSKRLIAIATGDSDGQVRSRALRALVRKGGDGVVALAQASLDDAYLGARLAALALLEKFAPAEATQVAQRLLGADDLALALRAAVLLHGQNGSGGASDLIARAYASPDWSSRSAAMNTAAEVLDAPAATLLAKQGLNDSHEDVRIAAARLLIRLGEEELGLAALRKATASTQLGPRLLAATELARRGETESVELLGRLARSGTPEQREAALGAHKAAHVISDGLVAALGDENISVRLAAADALLAL